MRPTLHHVALGARDVHELAGFYTEACAANELTRHHDDRGLRSVWLRFGQTVLMIERTDAPCRERRDGVDAGWFLVAFDVEGGRAAANARLARVGVTPESATEHTDYYRDPEGNRFAVSEYPIAVA